MLIGCRGFACGCAPRCFGLRPRWRYGCCGLARGRVLVTSGRFRRKWAPISPWVLGFCAVFGGSCSQLASPTWGNADTGWRFGPIRPAKPPRSCERGSRATEVAHLDTCSDSVSAGRRSRMSKRLKPVGVQAVSRKLVWWRGECGRVCQMAVRDRVRAKPGYCPYCSGRKRPERPIRFDWSSALRWGRSGQTPAPPAYRRDFATNGLVSLA